MNLKNPRNHRSSTTKSFNLAQFNERFYGNKAEQIKTILHFKFPEGFVCPECGCMEYRWLDKRNVCQCKKCYTQTSLLASTIFQDSKLSFYQLLLGVFFFVTSQSGISGTTLASIMGVNINTARLFLRKLRTACRESSNSIHLESMIDFDGAYLGGVEEGGKRGLGAKKQTILVGVEMVKRLCKTKNGYIEKLFPARAKFKLVDSENGQAVVDFMNENVKQGTLVNSDGGRGISVLNQVIKDVDNNVVCGKDGEPIKRYNFVLKNDKFNKNSNPLEFVHKFISNLKSMFQGIYHGIAIHYMDLFIEEYLWRFNHRTDDTNLQKIESVFKAIFQTKVKTAKDFKREYANIVL